MLFLICSLPLRLHFEDWGSVSVLHPVEKAALFGLWQQRDKKKDDDFVSLFDITTESLFAVGIVLLGAKIISAIAWLITLIKTKHAGTHVDAQLLPSTPMGDTVSQCNYSAKASGCCLKSVRPGQQPPRGHISVYMIHIISGCTQNTTHITVSLSDPSKALMKWAPLDK